jgi:hypothetical protein
MPDDQKNPNDFEAEIEAQIETEIAAGLAAELAKKREELAYKARRKIEMAHLDKVNARHPVEDKYGGLGPEGHAARLKAMEAGSKADKAWHDRVNSRPIEGSLLDQRMRANSAGGAAGFRIKRPGEL